MQLKIDIDESSDDSDYMLAPWFDEPNEVANTTANTTQLSSNSTQILDTTFELDSNHSYSQVSLLRIKKTLKLLNYLNLNVKI